MSARDEDQDAEAPQRGVSSLRSLFERRADPSPASRNEHITPGTPVVPNRPNRDDPSKSRTESRGVSLDLPRQGSPDHFSVRASPHLLPSPSVTLDGARWTPRLRPKSMLGQWSPPRSPPRSPPKSPFLVTVQSPDSSPQAVPFVTDRYGRHSVDEPRTRDASRNPSPVRTEKPPLRLPPPQLNTLVNSINTTLERGGELPQTPSEMRTAPKTPVLGSNPPPVNRAAKPSTFSAKVTSAPTQQSSSLRPVTPREGHDEKISPFSTPPSESEDAEREPTPPVPQSSKPKLASETQGPNVTRGLGLSNQGGSRIAGRAAVDTFQQRLQTVIQDEQKSVRSSGRSTRPTRSPSPEKPSLPPRMPPPPVVNNSRTQQLPTTSQSTRASLDIRPAIKLQTSEAPPMQQNSSARAPRTVQNEEQAEFVPPLPRRSLTHEVRSPSVATPAEHRTPQLPSRPSIDSARPSVDRGYIRSNNWQPSPDKPDVAGDESFTSAAFEGSATDYPDNSQTNRRPPRFENAINELSTRYETKLVAVSGEYVCTSGYITRVWSLISGEQLMSISHGETVKATAVAFKPAQQWEDEGKRIWIGTNMGELQEIDIPSQSLVASSRSAHGRAPITKIFRQGPDLWTLDDEGKWVIWPPNESGTPDLNITPQGCRIPRNVTFSMVVGDSLWAAYGKEVQIYRHNAQTRTAVQVVNKPLMQSGVGEVTSGAVMSKQPDRVYLGHIDGKITVYSSKNYSCLNIINVSLYKISNLTGVGDYLWAAFNTGMIYVYDTECAPWQVKKDWRAHQSTIAGFVSDRSSIWKLDRLQVVSLGTDNLIQVWDGMLRDDWLEQDLQQSDSDYCQFNEVSALVMTWNAGASKPKDLRHDQRDSNFFRELLTAPDVPPDILVFGFQELVDLEDKKVTAKSLFKSSKKKENVDHEHISHAYRAWRDELTAQINTILGLHEPYILLHTANLIGLFTCIYVKASLKPRLRFLNAAEVKLGMGGLHGNKGALLVRFVLDDSSICLINCHLAAGQKHTVNRNNDVAAIMESSSLAFQTDPVVRSDNFVGGGDGCMILDHEICILNGDLNYRIDAIPRDTVIAAVSDQNLAKLLDRDQLLTSRRKNPGFRLRVFHESPITFPPTYKYDVGTDRYDTSEKKRSPAWCDRILYRGLGGKVKQLNYRRHEVHASDHRPVSALFRLSVKTIDQKRKGQSLARSVERFEAVKQRIAMDVKLDYLINVFGLSLSEGRKLLQ